MRRSGTVSSAAGSPRRRSTPSSSWDGGGEWYQDGLRAGGRERIFLENDGPSAERLAGALQPGDRVLFKASRKEKLEKFADRVGALLEGDGGES